MNYIDKETNVTEQENSLNEERTYQEMLRADPDYDKWLDEINSINGEMPEKEIENVRTKE